MDQNAVGTGFMICLGAAKRFVQTPSSNQRFYARDHRKVVIGLSVFPGFDFAAELIDIGQRLVCAEERICLWKQLIFDANCRDIALDQLVHQSAEIIEISVTRVRIDEDRYRSGIRHEFQNLEDLRPRGFIAVAHTKCRRN